jgi:hypothetical protein
MNVNGVGSLRRDRPYLVTKHITTSSISLPEENFLLLLHGMEMVLENYIYIA